MLGRLRNGRRAAGLEQARREAAKAEAKEAERLAAQERDWRDKLPARVRRLIDQAAAIREAAEKARQVAAAEAPEAAAEAETLRRLVELAGRLARKGGLDIDADTDMETAVAELRKALEAELARQRAEEQRRRFELSPADDDEEQWRRGPGWRRR